MSTSWLIAITWFLWSNVSKQDHMPLNPESRVGLYLPVKSNILTDTKSNWHCLIAYVGFFLGSEFTLQLQMFQKGKMKVIWDLHAVSLLIKIHFHQNSHCCPSSKISIKVRNTSVLWRAKKERWLIMFSYIGEYSKLLLPLETSHSAQQRGPQYASKVYFVKSLTIEMWDSSAFDPLSAFT